MENSGKNILKIVSLAVLISISVLVFFFSRNLFLDSEDSSISELLKNKPYNRTVKITGQITKVMKDYVTMKGDTYFQFYVSDGENSIKVFCKRTSQDVDFEEDNQVEIMGRFTKFGKTLEITHCNSPYGYVKVVD